MPQNVGSIEDLITVLQCFYYAALLAELHTHAKRKRAEPLAKKIWIPIHTRNFGSHVTLRPLARSHVRTTAKPT